MIDIHPPQHAPMTRREFFVHLFIVVLGILIAIGLEQGVEAIHHAHERRELRAALYTESGQILKDSGSIRQYADGYRLVINWRIAQLGADLHDNRPVPPGRKTGRPPIATSPNDPVWEAAKTSNSAALLDRDELTAYGDLSQTCGRLNNAIEQGGIASRPVVAYALRLGGVENLMSADLSHASRSEIQEMIERLGNLDVAMQAVAAFSSDAEGTAEAIYNGERDIAKIKAAGRAARKRDDDAFAARRKSDEAVLTSNAADGGSRR